MTVIAGVLLVAVLVSQLLHAVTVRRLLDGFERERRSLLDRIQHPDRVQVAPATDYEPPVPPRDTAEMAYVGMEVPEFIDVGSEEQHG